MSDRALRDPLTIPTPLNLLKRMLLATTPFGGLVFENEYLFSSVSAQMQGY